jgi:hypothetical protein
MGKQRQSCLAFSDLSSVKHELGADVEKRGVLGSGREMVSLIPRKFSLAVSGTPARNATKDLQQALKYAFSSLTVCPP